jgi:predicted metal-binding protein
MSVPVQLLVCRTCSPDGGFVDVARQALPDLEVRGVECMSGCTRAQTVAFRSPGKVAYLFGKITEANFEELRTFARLYDASEDGTFDDARVLGDLRTRAIARIPG